MAFVLRTNPLVEEVRDILGLVNAVSESLQIGSKPLLTGRVGIDFVVAMLVGVFMPLPPS